MEPEVNSSPNLNPNVQGNNEVLKQKKLIIVVFILVIILLLGIIFMYFSFKKNISAIIPSKTENSQKIIQNPGKVSNQEVKIPENQVIGKIKEVSSEKITVTLSPIYSPGNQQQEIDKEVTKNQVDEIKKLIKNPDFNAEKAKQIQEEMQKKYEQNPNVIAEPSEENKQLAEDKTLSPFVEEAISWKDLAVGNQVTYQGDPSGSGKKILVVISDVPSENAPPLDSNININNNK